MDNSSPQTWRDPEFRAQRDAEARNKRVQCATIVVSGQKAKLAEGPWPVAYQDNTAPQVRRAARDLNLGLAVEQLAIVRRLRKSVQITRMSQSMVEFKPQYRQDSSGWEYIGHKAVFRGPAA